MQHLRILISLTAVLIFAQACETPGKRVNAYVDRAQELYEAGDYVKARLEVRNAIQIQPKNIEARYLAVLIAEKTRNYDDLYGNLVIIIGEDPQHVKARVKLGTLYFFAKSYDDAAEQAEAAMALDPDDPDVRLLHARVLEQRGDHEAAVSEIETALSLDADNQEAILMRASAYSAAEPEKALQLLDAAIGRLPAGQSRTIRQLRLSILDQQQRTEDVEREIQALIADFPAEGAYQYQLAQFYAREGRADEAEKILRRMIEADPENIMARLGLVEFLGSTRSPQAQEQALLEFIEDSPDSLKLRMALGRFYETHDRPADALEVYRVIAEKAPRDADGYTARNRIASIKVSQGAVDEARVLVDEILADAPGNADALLMRAGFRISDGDSDSAIADLRLALREHPDSQRAKYLLARTYAEKGDVFLATTTFRQLIDQYPEHAGAANDLAALLISEGKLDEAEEVVQARLAIEPGDHTAGSRLVDILIGQSDLDAAEQQARRLIESDDEQGLGELQLGRVLQAKQQYDKAIAAYRRALEKNPAATRPLELIVRSLVAQDKLGEAIDVLDARLEQFPEHTGAKVMLGGVYARKGDRRKAEELFESVLAEQPGIAGVYAALARLYTDDAQARIRTYRRGLQAVPGNPQLGLFLGGEYENAERFDDAIGIYDELLQVHPDRDLAANNLAALLLDFRQDDASIKRALALAERFEDSENAFLLDTLGWAYYRAGYYARAVKTLSKALLMAEDLPILRYHLGMAYLATDNPDRARKHLDFAVSMAQADFTGIDEARKALGELDGN
jgi:tetratricopeptide (TPR) repeat protein